MELSKLAHRNGRDQPRGVALLISLSVILLLSIALMKNFEKRSLEVAHLGNNLERFQAESLARSGLNLILTIIREKGLSTVDAYRNQLKEIPIPIGNGLFQLQEFTPIDHRFNLNPKTRNGDDARVLIFKNMVRMNKALVGGYNYLSGESENEALSAINDWIDRDQDMDTVFHYDSEQYYREEPSFSVKNREFDRLSEVRLLPAFRALGITADYLENNFRVLGQSEEYIDVNLIDEKSLREFLGRYDSVEGYPNLYDRRDDIVKLIMDQRLDILGITSGPGQAEVPFPAKSFQRNGDWFKKLAAANTDLNPEEQELFKPYSEHLSIQFQVQVGKVKVSIRSIVQVKYLSIEKNLDIKDLTILTFRII